MKILTVLCVLQLAALLGLFFKFNTLENSMHRLALADHALASSEPRTTPPPRTLGPANARFTPAKIEQLRGMVREELAIALQSVAPTEQSAKRLSSAPAQQTGDQHKAAEYAYEREIAQNEIAYFVSRGSISESEMAGLQIQISKLDQAGRKEMLRELVKAMNSGDLEGRL
jgi:hypothetical protein